MGTPGRLGHGRGGGVHAEDQAGGFRTSPGEDRPAVASTEIDDHPVGPGDQVRDLADVDVRDVAADHLSHGRQSTLGP